MKNKVKLKRFIFKVLIFTICLIGLFLIINIYKQHIFTKNYNTKIVQIISKVKEEYPDLDENKLITILNSDKVDVSLLQKYSININKDDLILENAKEYKEMLIINTSFIIITIIVCLITFLKFNSKKDKEINEITKYIEEINRKNYKLNIDDMSEDELSILKNEVYKTTIMLKEAAENSNKEKLELKDSLSDISHQLKTPLTSILIILNNLIDDPDMDKEIREDFIRDIKMEITNISFLVQSILKLSKLDTNTVDFIEEKTYIKDIVDEVIKNISTLCDLRNIKIITKYKENAQIICDFRWQVEAFSNIIKNCIEHSKDNSNILLEVDENNVYSQVVIRDNGTGIDKEDLPHIFERFYKGKNSSNESCGIGLSLAKSIIEKSNGNIYVESKVGKGSTFTIKYFRM